MAIILQTAAESKFPQPKICANWWSTVVFYNSAITTPVVRGRSTNLRFQSSINGVSGTLENIATLWTETANSWTSLVCACITVEMGAHTTKKVPVQSHMSFLDQKSSWSLSTSCSSRGIRTLWAVEFQMLFFTDKTTNTHTHTHTHTHLSGKSHAVGVFDHLVT